MTNLEILNMALVHAGANRVDSVSDPVVGAEIGSLFINIARQTFIQQSKLSKTIKESALALADGETSNIYTYVYTLPADCLNPVKIWNGNVGSDPVIYEIGTHSLLTSSVIKTDYEDAILIYSVDIENLNVFTAADHLAISYLLASYLAMGLKLDDRRASLLEQKYITALSVAIANDRNGQSVDYINNARFDSITNSRQ